MGFQHSEASVGSPNEGENMGLTLIRVFPPEEMVYIRIFVLLVSDFLFLFDLFVTML